MMPHKGRVGFTFARATVFMFVITIPAFGGKADEHPAQSLSQHRELGEAPRGKTLGIDGGSVCRSPRQYMGGGEMWRKYLRWFKPRTHS